MTAVIRTDALTKHYGRVHALDGLDLTVDEGQVHGFLGPNGAGKSTTIRILLGLARPTSGTATVLGGDPWAEASRLHRRIASVPGDVSLWPNLSGGEAIDLLCRLRTGGRGADAEVRRRLCADFDLDTRTKGRAYSKGNRQKVALVAAFAVPADLYVFDEPTSGLDPLMEVVFRQEVARVGDAGATVLLSSHILSEVELLCDRVSIVRGGRIVDAGTLAEMRHLTRTEVSFVATDRATLAAARAVPGAEDVTQAAGRISLTLASDAVAAALPRLGALGAEGLRVAPPSLEELFLRHYSAQPAGGSR
ncbi:ABC transporter ATP-binding protein [Microbacterium laevaniformans]|uniref:ABC transporter ATP-binding protein n=1 Tax=Microbacterium laevaniformans TaxID=36807 RepID=UPI00195CC530|nr:ABC transporter ATP-binding protein [Microbacterium laevaniformans]MBM7753643.1 ABC-2 type transport system ATP-binding protein [Microbacterium laevaniformans]GLJ64200.1 tetronasin ABC transporter ATP-binding protein [Microbacterium laevaniformans]